MDQFWNFSVNILANIVCVGVAYLFAHVKFRNLDKSQKEQTKILKELHDSAIIKG